jgi:SAM-dependent methyltransferase
MQPAPARPSLAHLERHARDIEEYRHNVSTSAPARYDGAWWGVWEHAAQLPEDGVVVDLGAGSGHFLGAVRARRPDARLVGVELHPKMLALLQERAATDNIEVVQADLGAPLPPALPAGMADVVTSVLVFHELPYPPDLLRAAAHLLKPGGRLVLHDIVKFPLRTYMAERKGGELSRDALDHYREHCLFTPEDLAFLVENAGLEVKNVHTRNRGRFATVVAQAPEN